MQPDERASGPTRRSSHQLRHVRQPLPWPDDRPFRILSIDGGGIKGVFPAGLLARAEREFLGGAPAGEYFDLIAGSSTGGIIAAALGIGISAQEILTNYLSHGASVFPSASGPLAKAKRAYSNIRGLWRYRYEREPLQKQLDELFGERTLAHSARRLCIPAFDGSYNEVHVFKTPHHPDFRLDWKERLVDVALATAAAPTYFSVYRHQGRQFADGGIWANNPILVGLVDALACHRLSRRSVHILSLGCGDGDLPFSQGQQFRGGLWHWRNVVEAAIRLQGQNAEGLARALVGSDQVVRVGPEGAAAEVRLDDFPGACALVLPEIDRQWDIHANELAPYFRDRATPYSAYHGPRLAEVV